MSADGGFVDAMRSAFRRGLKGVSMPRDVRVRFGDGPEWPLKLTYWGVDFEGAHVWLGELGWPPDKPPPSGVMSMRIGVLPPDTKIRFRLVGE